MKRQNECRGHSTNYQHHFHLIPPFRIYSLPPGVPSLPAGHSARALAHRGTHCIESLVPGHVQPPQKAALVPLFPFPHTHTFLRPFQDELSHIRVSLSPVHPRVTLSTHSPSSCTVDSINSLQPRSSVHDMTQWFACIRFSTLFQLN